MGTEPEVPRTDEESEQEGGPVKSFLEHLEDLRWVLIKSLAATGLGMLLCGFLYHVLVNVLVHVTRPFPYIHFARTHPQLSHDMGREVLIRKEIDSGAREFIPHVSYNCRSISGGADVVAFGFRIRLRVDVGHHLAGWVSRSPFFNFLHFNRVRQRTAGPCRGEDFAAGEENRCGL